MVKLNTFVLDISVYDCTFALMCCFRFRVTKEFIPDADSVYRPWKHENCPTPSTGGTRPRRGSLCSCNTHESDWFVFDNKLVLPEYVVDFEYTTKVSVF